MMDIRLKERLVGATVLVLAAVLFIPMVLDGPGANRTVSREVTLPDSEAGRRTVRLDLDENSAAGGAEAPVTVEEPVSIDLVPAQQAESTPEPEVPAVREQAPAADVAPPAATTDAPWTVQVGSFSDDGNAEALAAKLRGLGFPAHVSRFNDGKRIHYRVRVGGFPSRDAAQTSADEIRAKTGEPAAPTPNR